MTVTSTALRTRGMRDSARRAMMAALLQRGGSMPHDEFSRLLAGRYTTDKSISAAKAKMGEVLELVSSEAVQMHGGIGVTDELDVGLYLKRGRVCVAAFGDASFHRDRVARMSGL